MYQKSHAAPHLRAQMQIRRGLCKKQPQWNVAQVNQASMHGRLLSVLKWWSSGRSDPNPQVQVLQEAGVTRQLEADWILKRLQTYLELHANQS